MADSTGQRVGQQLGNYQLTRLLGEGGFAEVYLGEHVHLGSQAAIKVLHSQLTSEDVDKFRTEARNLVRLVHPHIVRVLDFGIEGKTPFLVMDYASNGTLRQLHPKGTPLSLATVVSYVKQIADALQFAHDEKLIHRDIKPENMLLGRRNEILLSDFGIAIVAQSSRYQNAQDMAGTIAYMAPEQIQAHPRPASDQYSLGVVVYEWLSGDRPFHGSFSEIAIKHTVVPPSPLREKIATISADVEQVVMTALAKEPKERFGSVQAFARALEQASQLGQGGQLAATIIVKPPAPIAPSPRLETPSNFPASVPAPLPPSSISPTIPAASSPSNLPAKMPVTPPLPPTQLAWSSKPVGTTLYVYRGHSGRVNAVAWSPDSKKIASGGDDKTVRVWEAITGDKAIICSSHFKQVNAVAWSPSGLRIVSGSSDATVQIWDTTTGNKGITYRGHSDKVNAVVWSPDRQFIASGSDDKTVQIWDADKGSYIVIYRGHSDTVMALGCSLDGKRIISGGIDKEVQLWNPLAGRKVFTYRGHNSWVKALAWSPDGKFIVSGSDNGEVQVWDVATGKAIIIYRDHSGEIRSLAWSPDGRRIASAGEDQTVQVWNAASGNKIFSYQDHSDAVNALAWSPDGKYIASASNDQTVHVWVAP